MSGRIPTLSEIWEVSREGGIGSESPHLWDGLRGWPMQEASGRTLYSPASDYHAVMGRDTQSGQWATTRFGKGLSFIGSNNDYCFASADAIDFDADFTYAGWVFKQLGGTQAVWFKGSGGQQAYAYFSSSDWLRFDTDNGASDRLQSSIPITANSWWHLACGGRYSDNRKEIWINGRPDVSNNNLATGINHPTNDLILGSGTPTVWNSTATLVLQHFWQRFLSDDEIALVYDDFWSIYRKRPVQVAVAVDDITATNAFGSDTVSFTWTVNP